MGRGDSFFESAPVGRGYGNAGDTVAFRQAPRLCLPKSTIGRPYAYADKLRQIVEQSRQRSAVYDVITHGYGAMFSYAERVAPRDRWAIAAYIRALQVSGNARLADVPAAQRQQLQ